ncbi:hypothetical protein BYT27DRAFT_7095370 [Phlegmacium glaucopus]|nr:hypothetical protein BYT27DRAFT_7095370 [Phlegmacium glaucopus]
MPYFSTRRRQSHHPHPRSPRPSTQPGLTFLSPYSTTVVCTFIPSLPDELTICVAETLPVLAEYEDGWSLCIDC